ncbi:MAG: MFS transporter [Anaerolineales bacterium]|uniref:MFS transporter n=1 Tax=Candidatus Villigracilis vicinus TaxID=3140679 RepID=UPI00313569BE|nr:MFS transporter [Anaerolineales bacterium]
MRFNLFKQSDIPEKYRSNFTNLYLDIAWFGVVSGTAVNFLNVYATRLGASGLQIGLLTAAAAVVNLFLAIPAGHWISKRPTGQAVFWSSVLFRIGYFFWIPLPWFFNEQGQIWALIVLAFLMAIPLTPLGVGFNALFAEAVPDRYRARVAGTRNVTFAIAYMLTSLIAGYILKNTEFPGGYQVIFIIGAFGAAMSSYHIYHVKPLRDENPASPPAPIPVAASQSVSPRSLTAALRLDVWNSKFKHVLLAMFIFHFSHYLSSPLYPIFNVRVLNLNDSHLGNGTALYYLSVLLASTQLGRIVNRFGNKRITGWGVAGMASYPLMLAFAQNVWQFYALSFLGGFLFALVNGAYANYMLENIPPDDRPSHLAWYTIMFNFAILASSLIGPVTADAIGLINALIVFGIARILAGLFLLKWG